MLGSLIKFHILFHCLLDGGQFILSQSPKISSYAYFTITIYNACSKSEVPGYLLLGI